MKKKSERIIEQKGKSTMVRKAREQGAKFEMVENGKLDANISAPGTRQ